MVQDLTLGLAAWMQHNSDELAMSLYEIITRLPARLAKFPLTSMRMIRESDVFRLMEMRRKERSFIYDGVYTSSHTDAVLMAEMNAHPGKDGSLLEAALGLTGEDLLECHAAILTERYICSLIAKHPSAFNQTLLPDLESYFRVDQMESCQKVLNLFRLYLHDRIKFDAANRQHPLYPLCGRPAEYGLLLFALDFALHMCPLDDDSSTLPPDIQDAIPAIRFLKIIGAMLPCILQPEVRPSFVLHEKYLYSTFLSHLVAFNNRCNERAGRAPTFYHYSDITERWRNMWLHETSRVSQYPIASLFRIFFDYRLKALSLMQSDPTQVYESNIADLARTIGFNPMFSTNKVVRLATPYVLSVMVDEDQGGGTKYVIPPSPWEMTDSFVGREIFKGVSEMIFFGDCFRCPVARRISYYPCEHRTDKCESIRDPNSIPPCFARQVLMDFYPVFAQAQ